MAYNSNFRLREGLQKTPQIVERTTIGWHRIKMKTKNIFVVGILLLVLLPFIQAVGEEELSYQLHNPSKCFVNLRDESIGQMYKYDVDVKINAVGNKIIKSFDGRPKLPVYYNPWYGENGCSSKGLNYQDYPNFWNFVSEGYIERIIEYCPQGVIDPLNDGIDNYQCIGLCVPEKSVCIDDSTLKRCSIDGNSISTELCGFRCYEGGCINPNYNLFLTADDVYEIEHDINIDTKFLVSIEPDVPLVGSQIRGYIYKEGVKIKEQSAFTDETGGARLTFTGLDQIGEVEIRVTTNYLGIEYTKSKIVNLVGRPIIYKVSTYSYVQYNAEPIRFNIELKDLKGRSVYPGKLNNLRVESSLTNGQIISNNIEYKGSGLYEITSIVSGVGGYIGKILFTYDSQEEQSPSIEIDVEKTGISIDSSQIDPIVDLNEQVSFSFKIYDSFGKILIPENLWAEIQFPDGVTVRQIPFSEIRYLNGEYTFDFIFTQVEKHTLNIYATKEGYVLGNSISTIIVGGGQGMGAGPEWFSSIFWIVPLFFVLFFIVAYFLTRKKRGRRK